MAYGTPQTYKVKLDEALAENVRLQATITRLTTAMEAARIETTTSKMWLVLLTALKEKTDE